MPPYPIGAIRSLYPAIAGQNAGTIYLDNPAGTQVPQAVAQAVAGAMSGAASNLGAAR